MIPTYVGDWVAVSSALAVLLILVGLPGALGLYNRVHLAIFRRRCRRKLLGDQRGDTLDGRTANAEPAYKAAPTCEPPPRIVWGNAEVRQPVTPEEREELRQYMIATFSGHGRYMEAEFVNRMRNEVPRLLRALDEADQRAEGVLRTDKLTWTRTAPSS